MKALLLAFAAFRGVSDSIIAALGDRFAEKQALYDKSRIRSPVLKEIVLARKMADSAVLQAWAENENDLQLKAAALKELDSYREYFSPNSSPKCDTLQFKRLASFLQKPWLAA